MADVGSTARRATNEFVAAMSIPDRMTLALALGDEDIRLFMAANHVDRPEAIARIRRARHHGRRRSVAGNLDGAS